MKAIGILFAQDGLASFSQEPADLSTGGYWYARNFDCESHPHGHKCPVLRANHARAVSRHCTRRVSTLQGTVGRATHKQHRPRERSLLLSGAVPSYKSSASYTGKDILAAKFFTFPTTTVYSGVLKRENKLIL